MVQWDNLASQADQVRGECKASKVPPASLASEVLLVLSARSDHLVRRETEDRPVRLVSAAPWVLR